ncbi:MAG: hypothetical protein WCA56_03395 [Xanthobacteraceae bacterium]|jgi:hypothetical protein
MITQLQLAAGFALVFHGNEAIAISRAGGVAHGAICWLRRRST